MIVLALAFYEVKNFNNAASNNQNVSEKKSLTSESSNSNTSSPLTYLYPHLINI